MNWQSDLQAEFDLNQAKIAAFELFLKLITDKSDRNLTAVTSSNRIVDVHFRDSLSLQAFPEFVQAKTVVDIGSGAGFPGLPLAVISPEKTFTLLESNASKCEFIASAAARLELANVRALAVRAEDAGRTELRESFDLALCRAVGALSVVLEYAMPLLVPGGSALLQRGSREQNDSQVAASVSAELGGKLFAVAAVTSYPGSKNLHG